MEKLKEKQERKKNKKNEQKAASSSTTATPKVAPISVGENVKIKGQTSVGQVMEISGKNAIVAFGSIKTTVKLDRLERSNAAPKTESIAKVPLSAARHMTRCTKRNLVSNKISMCVGCAETKRCKQSLILLTMLYWSVWTVYVFFTEQEQESFVHSSANICPPYRVSAIMPTSMCSSEVPESQ